MSPRNALRRKRKLARRALIRAFRVACRGWWTKETKETIYRDLKRMPACIARRYAETLRGIPNSGTTVLNSGI